MIREVRTEPFIFSVPVSEAGYEWLKGTNGKPYLVPRHVPGVGFHRREPPPGLFREFAELSPSRDVIRDFARQHGDLLNRELEKSVVREDGTVTFGASLGTWTQEIGDMRVLVELWEQIQHKRIAGLRKVVKWGKREVGYVIETPRRTRNVMLAHEDIPETGLSRFDRDDVLLPARCALQQEINLRLAEQPTVPRLAWTPDYHQRIVFTPPNLLAAMWLQFAQAVTGELELCQCVACGKFFQRGPGGRRADSTTCSNACRQRWYRESKK